MFLEEVVAHKRKEVVEAKAKVSKQELMESLEESPRQTRDFKTAIAQKRKVSLIAEIKRKSPSRGMIRPDLNIEEIAYIYQKAGARAISVLTDEMYFGGRLEFIGRVKKVVSLPVLRKEFIIDEYQLYESCFLGADAVLLIAAILSLDEIKRFLSILSSLKMQALVEAHTEEDVKKCLDAGAEIIGINNRNLNTLKVDMTTTERLKKLIPDGRIVVAESGIKKHKEIKQLKAIGINAVLIGGAFMERSDIAASVKEVMRGKWLRLRFAG